MKIFVLSDTHYRDIGFSLDSHVMDEIADCEFIIHCGDFVTAEVYEHFSQMKPVQGVLGNMDYGGLTQMLPHKRVVDVGGVSIGVIHGWGSPISLVKKVLKEFSGVDAICFGHSHIPHNEMLDDVLMFNPGSLSGRFLKESGSYGILDINDGKISGVIRKR